MPSYRKRPLQAENKNAKIPVISDLSDGTSGPRRDEDAPANGGLVFKSGDNVLESFAWKLEILPQVNQSLLSFSPHRARLRISASCLLCVEGRGRIRQVPRRGNQFPFGRVNKVDDHDDGKGKRRRTNGYVSIHGYALTEAFVDFDSPRWNSLLTIEASDTAVELDLESLLDSSSLSPRQEKPEEEPFVKVFDARQLNGARITVIPGTWASAVDSILTAYDEHVKLGKPSECEHLQNGEIQRGTGGFRVTLAGAKATGKSTCLRYLVNRFLSCDSDGIHELFVLDADCGQPELSPPGMVTLTRVTSPMLQPPHTRPVQQYEHACFFGHNTSSVDPPSYMDCIRELLTAFEAISSSSAVEPILLINLDGWVKSLGGQILEALMRLVSPNHVIQLTGDSKSQQFSMDYLDCERTTLHQAFSFNSKQEPSRGPLIFEEQLNSGIEKESFRAIDPPTRLSLPSATWRAIRMCSYFVHDAPFWSRAGIHQLKGIVDLDAQIGNRLAEAKPYQVSFDSVEWRGCLSTPDCGRGIRSESFMLDLLDASIVGLCQRAARQYDSALAKPNYHLLPCVGLGLIRAIDYERRVFYILTPVPFETLRSVDCLVRGSLLLPVECFFRGVQSDEFSYQSFDASGQWADEESTSQVLGGQPMQSRGNIGRRSLLKNASTYLS